MESEKLIERFLRLTRGTEWRLIDTVELAFNHHHAQGMLRIGDLFYLSSVEMTPGSAEGAGRGHLFAFDTLGRLVNHSLLGEGSMYHPGGIDFDGTHIWVSVAEYRPDSRTIVYRVDPATMDAEAMFRVNDHIGAVVRDGRDGVLIGGSWGSRKFYKWDSDGKELEKSVNPSHFIDYQDGRYVGHDLMLLSGIGGLPQPAGGAYQLGGLALVNTKSLHTFHEVPISAFSPEGRVITTNPVHVECSDAGLRLYAIPDDDYGLMLVYEQA